ncbi:hypothetical protein Bca4012_074951 [Brassica carinata]|uniref:F-box domain-containing protein n=2 Tax=Brassica TaxID=3705 RepID=A0ABQ7ZMH0_BRANA|nr:hypothetical protein Bca52824_067265 [Brassica carinata]KAH0881444.1 hypothetical protein HID58_068838 [Brassica napus]
MKSRRRNLSEEVPQTITRHSPRLLNADEESWSEIPIEVVIEIFSRLPLQSIARCRCVEAVGFNSSPSRLHGLVLHQIAGSPAAIDHETVLYPK